MGSMNIKSIERILSETLVGKTILTDNGYAKTIAQISAHETGLFFDLVYEDGETEEIDAVTNLEIYDSPGNNIMSMARWN